MFGTKLSGTFCMVMLIPSTIPTSAGWKSKIKTKDNILKNWKSEIYYIRNSWAKFKRIFPAETSQRTRERLQWICIWDWEENDMNTLLKSNPLKRTENQEKKIICILWDRLKSKPVYTQGKIA